LKKNKTIDIILRAAVYAAVSITLFALTYIIGYILINGIPHLTPSLFAPEHTIDNVSVLPAIITTVIMIFIALIIAVPFGIFSAIYLVEYAKRGNKVVNWVRVTTETLAGIPSIVYGLFGFLFFVSFLGWGFSVIAGAFTLSIMILPLIMRTTEEALKSVPDTYREGSFGLGAAKLRTVVRIVLPSAVPGILAGVILAVGRIAGETAALMFTAGTLSRTPQNLFASARTLSVHMYLLTETPGEAYTNAAYATAVVLLIIVVGINALSAFVARKLAKG